MHNLHYKKIDFWKIFVVMLVASFFSINVPHVVEAATTPVMVQTVQTGTDSVDNVNNSYYVLLSPLPNIGGGIPCTNVPINGISTSTCTADKSSVTAISLSQFISYAYKLMLALAVVLAVIMITIGGFEYMLSGAMNTKSEAKKRIGDAVAGLLLALCSYLILYTIDPNLVSPSNLTIPPITSVTTSIAPSMTQQLQNQANQLNTQAQNSVNTAKQTQATLADLQQQLSAAQQEYDRNCNSLEDPGCAQLDTEISSLKDQIANTTATVAATNNQAITTNMVSQLTNDLNLIVQGYTSGGYWGVFTDNDSIHNAAQKAMKQISSTTASRIAQLQAIPGSADQIAQVQDQQVYADIQIVTKVALATQAQYGKLNGDITTKQIIPDLDSNAAPLLKEIGSGAVLNQANTLISTTKTQLTNNIR